MSVEKSIFKYTDEGWDKEYLSSELVPHYDYKLVATKQSFGLFTMPVFSSKFCKELIDNLKDFTGWTNGRHKFYPTNDVLIENYNSQFAKIYDTILKNVIFPGVDALYDGNVTKSKVTHETFIIRYRPEIQGFLRLHHDASAFTILTTLSDLEDYEGGGTFFSEHNVHVKSPAGHVTIHPGNLTHKHGARPITSGERYVIVSFCRIHYG